MGKLKWLSCFVSSKRKEDSSDHSDDPANNPNSGDADGGVQGGDQRREGAKVFNFHELYTATNGFSQDCVIGRGGFGPVYKAQLGEQVVAIKQLNPDGAQGNQEFMVEVLMLSLLEHPNLVKLVGYCAEGVQRLVVYEYMPMGSLDKHLYDRGPDQPPLDWKTRMKIAAGAARGLQHLHHEANPQIIFRDLKPSNILLDSDYTPKLSDFGLAKLGPVGDKTHVTTRVMGTYGYCAPEYAMTGHLTTRSDVFSYGVVLLEILTGRKAMDSARRGQREESLVAWARSRFRNPGNYLDMADPLLEERFPKRGFRQAIAVAAMCVGEHSRTRPLMTEVVTALTFLESQAEGNAPARPGIMIGEPSQGASNDSGSSSSGPQPQGTIVGSSSTAPELEGFTIGSPITTLGEGSSSRTGDEPRVLIVGLPDQPSGSESQPARGSVSRRPGKEPEITMAPDSDRQRAVAEAVVWAEGAWHGRRGE